MSLSENDQVIEQMASSIAKGFAEFRELVAIQVLMEKEIAQCQSLLTPDDRARATRILLDHPYLAGIIKTPPPPPLVTFDPSVFVDLNAMIDNDMLTLRPGKIWYANRD